MMLLALTEVPSFTISTSQRVPVGGLHQLRGRPGVEPEAVDDE